MIKKRQLASATYDNWFDIDDMFLMWQKLHGSQSLDIPLEQKSIKGYIDNPPCHRHFKLYREREIQELTKRYVRPTESLYEIKMPIFTEDDESTEYEDPKK